MCDTDTPLGERLAALALDLSFIRQTCETAQAIDADVWHVIHDPDDGAVWHTTNKWQNNPEGRKVDLAARVTSFVESNRDALCKTHADVPSDLFALEVQKVLDEIKNAL